MKNLQILLLAAVVALTGACAHRPTELLPQQAFAAAEVASGADQQHPTPQPSAGLGPGAEMEDEMPSVRDPWEPFNRGVHGFNNAVDTAILRPLAIGYDTVVPDAAQASVSRFFSNLSEPVTAINQVLQGQPRLAAATLGRFAINTTVGVGGLFDPATHFGVAKSSSEDLGQTLGSWGWTDSRYLVLPLLGPRTVRDAVGLLADRTMSPLGQINDTGVAAGLQAVQVVDGRTRMLPLDGVRRDALDDYVFVRDAWTQRRAAQLRSTD